MTLPSGVRSRKVKTGCFTCKARRVKCDEERPYCRRCTSHGRRCEGYYSTPSLNSERRAEPPWALSLLPNCNEKERRYFNLYNVATVPNLCAYFGSYFWSTLLPQISMREPAVQHGLLALSALHESISCPGGPEHLRDRSNASTLFAVAHYNKAIRHLVAADSQLSTDVLLLCCIVFVCVELLRGNVREALNHIQSGLRVLQDARTMSSAPHPLCISSHPSNIRDCLDTILARLDVQSMFLGSTPQLFLSAPNASHPNNSPTSTTLGVPKVFSNLPEARAHFETLLNSCYRFMRAYPELQSSGTLSSEAGEAHAREISRLQTWADAFGPLFERSTTCSASIQRSAKILKIQHIASLIWVTAHNRRTEAEFGAYTNDFISIIALSREVVGASSQRSLRDYAKDTAPKFAADYTKLDFAFDFGAMPALHLTAMKCRVPHIRHEALDLLKFTPRQEGVFDRAFVMNLTAYSIEVEEAKTSMRDRQLSSIDNIQYTRDEVHMGLTHELAERHLKQEHELHKVSYVPTVLQVPQQRLIPTATDSTNPDHSDLARGRCSQQDLQTKGHATEYGLPPHPSYMQSMVGLPDSRQHQYPDQVWSERKDRAVKEHWQRDHDVKDCAAVVEAVDTTWEMNRQGVAKRASNGIVSEQKMGIMGYDATNAIYSFDFR